MLLNFISHLFLEITATGFLENIITQSPAMGILMYFAYKSMRNQSANEIWVKQLLEKESASVAIKDEEIKKLNDAIRMSEKENLEVLREMNSIIDQIMNNVKVNNEKVLDELEIKMQSLKNHIDKRISNNSGR